MVFLDKLFKYKEEVVFIFLFNLKGFYFDGDKLNFFLYRLNWSGV